MSNPQANLSAIFMCLWMKETDICYRKVASEEDSFGQLLILILPISGEFRETSWHLAQACGDQHLVPVALLSAPSVHTSFVWFHVDLLAARIGWSAHSLFELLDATPLHVPQEVLSITFPPLFYFICFVFFVYFLFYFYLNYVLRGEKRNHKIRKF